MIRYAVTEQDIKDEITRISGTWLTRANDRTKEFIRKKKYDESSGIWSKVKPVFMALQSNKCIFCERKFETKEYGKIEFDLEHFRPKSSIKAWPRRGDKLHYNFKTGAASKSGYYWLAYDVLNYAASCKVCNSTLKSNCFPIAGNRGKAASKPPQLTSENPFLCYPVSDFDDDPEDLLTFSATIAIPVVASGHNHRRGQVIIDFFRLNGRERLHQERAQMIMMLGEALKDLAQGDDVTLNTQIINKITTDTVPHTACSRAFRRLWDTDNTLALKIHRGCKQYVAGLIGFSQIG